MIPLHPGSNLGSWLSSAMSMVYPRGGEEHVLNLRNPKAVDGSSPFT